ncbi:MAG: aminotransferase class V-fold PLP-dependent enzyme [Oscillospiraceae bacterium]|jgi:cysteine desulfurase family protein|nr:aminotransferase class V-fold PLP-dependent enzyme [Oscillospiraceae bacterium]
MDRRIYFDNASTSFPKAPGVSEAMRLFVEEVGCNISRGGYADAFAAATVALEARERLSRLVNGPGARHVVFAANVTAALNALLKGYLRPGDHILVSAMEHNAVMRPLRQLEKLGVTFSRIPCDDTGALDPAAALPLIKKETRAICVTHASNVCGTLLPVAELGKIAQDNGLRFIVDSAQTAGVFPISMAEMKIDALAFTGHKGLLGPQGIGGFVIAGDFAAEVEPLIAGGTGSLSDSEEIPPFLPDRFEAGTLNLPGIYGLNAALGQILQTGTEAVKAREISLARRLEEGLSGMRGVRLLGTGDWSKRAAIVSADFTRLDNADLSSRLDEEYRILTRCGLHCAPNAHKTLGTFPGGTVRFSLSAANTEEEVDSCIAAVEEILGE